MDQSFPLSNPVKAQSWIEYTAAVMEYLRLYDLMQAWRKVRPFLWVSQCPYARSLALEMIDQLEQAEHHAVLIGDSESVELCRDHRLHWSNKLDQPPPPLKPKKRGFSFGPASYILLLTPLAHFLISLL